METSTFLWILAAGLATGVGGLGLLAIRDPSERLLDGLLGFTGGIMLGATAFSLLVPALDRGTSARSSAAPGTTASRRWRSWAASR